MEHVIWSRPTTFVFVLAVSTLAYADESTDFAIELFMADDNSQLMRDTNSSVVCPVPGELVMASPVPREHTDATQITDWWRTKVREPLRATAETEFVTLSEVLVRTLSHAPQIRVFSELPLLRQTAIVEANAAWDWTAFLESRWDDISEPVGNTLTVGTGDRFNDHTWGGSAGLRRRTRAGGRIEASQRLGWQDTNSDFFIPDQQGTTRLSLSYTQPLMRGRGRKYNESIVVLAAIDAGIAEQEFSRQLQSHILEVVRAYWGLYLERASLVQKRTALERARTLLAKLQARQRIDTVSSQVQRAAAEVAMREADQLRAAMAVANAESRLRTLVGDDRFRTTTELELVPIDGPNQVPVALDISLAMATAIERRPEITQALEQVKAASVRLDMSRHELLPTLNLVTEVYVSGLEGGGRTGRAWQSQFDSGAPAYTIGLMYEVPLGNRAAQARLQRKRLELRQLQNQYRTTLETLGLEVEVAVREVETSAVEVEARKRQTEASRIQLDDLTQRWLLLPGEGGTASLMLENLLDAQDRVADAEFALVSAQVTRDLAMVNLRRATGELLEYEQINWGTACIDGLPTVVVDKEDVPRYRQTGPTYVPPAIDDEYSEPIGAPAVPPTPVYFAPVQADVGAP